MYAQSSPNPGWLEYGDVNDKSVLSWKVTKSKIKTNTDSGTHRFHAGRAHHNEMIIFEYSQLCQILHESALAALGVMIRGGTSSYK